MRHARVLLLGVGIAAVAVGLSLPACQRPPAAPSALKQVIPNEPPGTRDPRRQPFASSSLWNTAIGSGAILRHAHLAAPTRYGVFDEEEILAFAPTAPQVEVFRSDSAWDKRRSRQRIDGPRLATVPLAPDFTNPVTPGETPNAACALLMPDGRTLHQSQPFAREVRGGSATTWIVFADGDLYGDGLGGAHGGSGISALGGTIRLGELVPGGRIPHPLKVVFDCRFLSHPSDGTPGFRWPAQWADQGSYWSYRGRDSALEMGCLLALPGNFDLTLMQTGPGRIVAQAFLDYGAYMVDSSGWDAFYLAVEWSPEGRVLDEFAQRWGMPFRQPDSKHPWSQDLALIITNLHVATNNGPDAIGGGGVPRQPQPPTLIPWKSSSP